MDKNYTSDFQFAVNIVQIAFDELEQHHATRNYTGLITRYYKLVEEDYGDPRAFSYPLMESPLPTFGIVAIYLAWILVIGPAYMRDRKPMNLRNVLVTYNAFQVILSGYMFYEHLMAGWLYYYNTKCQPVDYSDTPMSRRMLNLCYVYYLSKLSEFADTVFFVLRKKKSQISWLHVYHHSLTPLETWFLVKFTAGGNATFPNLLNNFVHVCMYFYYMMAAMGPQYAKFLWWKRYMTELQIAQFVLCIFHIIRSLFSTHCGFSKFISLLLLLNSSIFFCLFMNFYIQNYQKKSSTKNNEIKESHQDELTKSKTVVVPKSTTTIATQTIDTITTQNSIEDKKLI